MDSQQWIERRDSRKQHTPNFRWVPFRRTMRQHLLGSAPVMQIYINYLVWKANLEQAQRQPATTE
jgi:hypothetical protein